MLQYQHVQLVSDTASDPLDQIMEWRGSRADDPVVADAILRPRPRLLHVRGGRGTRTEDRSSEGRIARTVQQQPHPLSDAVPSSLHRYLLHIFRRGRVAGDQRTSQPI